MPEKRSTSELASDLVEAYKEILKANIEGMSTEPRADYLKLLQRKMSAANALLPYVFTPDGEEADELPGSAKEDEIDKLAVDLGVRLPAPSQE